MAEDKVEEEKIIEPSFARVKLGSGTYNTSGLYTNPSSYWDGTLVTSTNGGILYAAISTNTYPAHKFIWDTGEIKIEEQEEEPCKYNILGEEI
jgi:hypothetical protein